MLDACKILTRECESPIDILINANVVPRLIEFLSRVNNPHLQLELARALTNIVSGTFDQTKAVVNAGAVAGFVSLLGSSHPVVALQAVRALGIIARDGTELNTHITEQGTLNPLINLIKPDTSSTTLLRSVAWTLSNLCRNEYSPLSIYTIRHQLLPALAHLLNSNDKEIVASACMALSHLIDYDNYSPAIKKAIKNPEERLRAIIDAGVVNRLVALLVSNEEDVFNQSLLIIKDITTWLDPEDGQAEAFASSTSGFIFLLSSNNPDVVETAVWVLGVVAESNAEARDEVIKQGIIKPLVSLIKPDTSVELLSDVTWTLFKLCKYHKHLPSVPAVRQLLPVLVQLIHNDDDDIFDTACQALDFLTEGDEIIQELVDAGVVPRLVALLNHNKAMLFSPLNTISKIVSGSTTRTDLVLSAGICPLLAKLLVRSDMLIIHYAVKTVSKIAAGNVTQIQALVTNNVIRPLVDVLSNVDFQWQKQAARAITNIACGGNVEQIALLYEFGAIAPLCTYILETKEPKRAKTIVVELDGLANILAAAEKMSECAKVSLHVKERGLLDRIGVLLRHDDIKIHPKSLAILERYFSTNGDEDYKLVPCTSQSSNYEFNTQPSQAPEGGFSL
ncbi:importin subunit alpha-5-like [Daphnia pulicaria]|uniref:importin subunit alpha-5-like n=1 Tax=Daphnia pulicaria TaxID=35523 RepID=UPI001EECE4FE|nr:importin subunit alpha-5-like [Daphnia pulicaria]